MSSFTDDAVDHDHDDWRNRLSPNVLDLTIRDLLAKLEAFEAAEDPDWEIVNAVLPEILNGASHFCDDPGNADWAISCAVNIAADVFKAAKNGALDGETANSIVLSIAHLAATLLERAEGSVSATTRSRLEQIKATDPHPL